MLTRCGRLAKLADLAIPATVLTALGVSVWLSALDVQYRDVRYAVPFFIQVWPFATPVSYSAADVPDRWFPQNSCNGLGALIVLGDEPKARAALPCLTYDSFHRVEFTNTVRLWGGDAVSLRPRLPGFARVGYALFLRS